MTVRKFLPWWGAGAALFAFAAICGVSDRQIDGNAVAGIFGGAIAAGAILGAILLGCWRAIGRVARARRPSCTRCGNPQRGDFCTRCGAKLTTAR